MKELADLLLGHFKAEPYKAVLWMVTPNNMLGGTRPATMIEKGRYNKLLKFVKYQIEQNRYPTRIGDFTKTYVYLSLETSELEIWCWDDFNQSYQHENADGTIDYYETPPELMNRVYLDEWYGQ